MYGKASNWFEFNIVAKDGGRIRHSGGFSWLGYSVPEGRMKAKGKL